MASSSNAVVTLPASEILFQIGSKLRAIDEIEVTVPRITTCYKAITSTALAIGEDNRDVLLSTPRTPAAQEKLRNLARENNPLHVSTNTQASFGLPIRPAADVKEIPAPKRASENTRQKLRDEARNWPTFPDPYLIMLQAHLEEQTLATVSGTVRLRGIDSITGDPECDMSSRSILFDTGAHSCLIVEDLLSDQFREYLRSPQNDPYKSEDRTRVQVDCTFSFSNHLFEISTIFVVVPRRAVPNGRVGIILGQKGLLDRMTYRSVPSKILKARGNDVEEGVWGDIVIEEYLTLDDELLIF